jgi:hypothetical protein
MDASGNAVAKGAYVENEWIEYGFTLSAEGGVGTLPRIFDTTSPGGETPRKCGDSDLGAPNKYCPGGGPGDGDGGKPGTEGENCLPQGNALIIQEPGESCPDDNGDGGIINFNFTATNGQYVYELGLLDVDYEVIVEIGYETSTGFKEREIVVPLLGDNSYQVLAIDQANVKWIKVKFERSGAITSIKLCPEEGVTPTPSETEPTSPSAPSISPPTSGSTPSVSPPTAASIPTKPAPVPTPAPVVSRPPAGPGGCELVTVGFDKDPDGNDILAGTYVENEWISLGLSLFAEGGEGSLPRIFDTANPGGETPDACGDSDLGAPNKYCYVGGPGRGEGGKPNQPGENCVPLGNALIVQEPGESCPDDNVNGGLINLDFPYGNGQYVKEIGLLDIDYETIVIVVTQTPNGFSQREIRVPLLGDNSYQVLEIDQENVKWIKLMLTRSGAMTSVTFCPK